MMPSEMTTTRALINLSTALQLLTMRAGWMFAEDDPAAQNTFRSILHLCQEVDGMVRKSAARQDES
jgi:hypothetical protein